MRIKFLAVCSFFMLSQSGWAASAPKYAGPEDCRVLKQNPVSNEYVRWSGGCKDGYAEGTGTLRWFYRDILISTYEGSMVKGGRQGQGVLVKTGSIYEGVFNDDKRQGFGKMTELGGSYEGLWDDDEPHGMGVVTYPNGTKQQRQFVHGIPQEQAEFADRTETKFTLNGDAHVGSRLPDALASGLNVPFNRSYSQLTLAQQLKVKHNYVFLGSTDEPPYPEGGPAAIIETIARSVTGRSGDLEMDVLIDEHGKFVNATVLKSPDENATQFAAAQFVKAKFKPAVCGGKPCAMLYPLRIRFD
ncbi:energy transducer TonB [Duganella sp. S19_KUP01_CR8]|uniref:energy transducer TonB n=1 Tax=Duganella sp. S19_KUP01_CR8 TaxID=3025502 RepID=UPI002FCD973E